MSRGAHRDAGGRRRRDEDGEGESYYVSMSDLMAGVLFLFIIMLTMFAVQLKTAPKVAAPRRSAARAAGAPAPVLALKRDGAAPAPPAPGPTGVQPPWAGPVPAPDARTRALTALADYLQARGVDVETDLPNGALRLPNAGLFDPPGAALSAKGRRAVTVLAQGMREVLPCYAASTALPPAADCPKADSRIGAIFVEGHADGRPDAWPLSVQQASNVFSALITAEPRLPSLQNPAAKGQSLLSVSGYGPSRPLAPGDARRNNRIDVRLVMAAG